MNWASSEAISVLWFLLPGFVAAGLFRSLVSNPRPSSGLDSIAQVFVFTVIVQVAARLIALISGTEDIGVVAGNSFEILKLVITAVAVGLVSAWAWNRDALHGPLRRMKITRQSSYPSAQYSAFAFYGDCYVVLHLKDQRRLFGWPTEWPSRPDDQHFLIEECEWLEDDGRSGIKGISHILIPAAEVEMIEFLPMDPQDKDEA